MARFAVDEEIRNGIIAGIELGGEEEDIGNYRETFECQVSVFLFRRGHSRECKDRE